MKVKELLLVLKNEEYIFLDLNSENLFNIDLCKPKNVLAYKNYIINEINVESGTGYIYIKAISPDEIEKENKQ